MFLPGTPCGCCGCQPCQFCAQPCLTVTFDGFAHGTGNCGECDFLDDTTFELKRRPDPQLSVTASVPSATGSGATFSVTTTRNATDGSYVVSGIKLLTGGANYSLGDAVAFQTNGCFDVTPTASITIATAQPSSANLRMASPASAVPPVSNIPGNVSVTYSEQTDGEGNKFWTVSKLGAIGGGSGYAENQTVTLTPGFITTPSYVDQEPGVVVQAAATARVVTTQRTTPALQCKIFKAVGDDIVLSTSNFIVLSQGTDANGRAVWSISLIGVPWWFPTDFTPADTVEITALNGATVVVPASVTLQINESGGLTAFNIVGGGVYYATNGLPEKVELLSGGAYYKPGVITSVTLTNGGRVWGPQVLPSGELACVYSSDPVCPVCPDSYAGDPGDLDPREELYASLQLGATASTLTVWRRSYYTFGITPPGRFTDIIILSATRPNVDAQGKPIPCDSLTFEPEHFSEQYSCLTNGTVTVSRGTCGASSSSACDLPDQIQITISGKDRAFGYGRQNFGAPPPGDPFGGQCGDYGNVCRFTGGGSVVGPSTWSGSLVAGGTAILDRQPGCQIVYTGLLPDPPRAGGPSGSISFVDCGGGLEGGGRPVWVAIFPAGLATSVFITGPTKQAGYVATAEVTGVSGAGAITAVAVTNGGAGYAREVFERKEPTVTVTLSGGGGSGAVLSATLTQSGSGEQAYWYVSAVSVTNGGTGYSGMESVVFTPGAGDTADWSASAFVVVGRVAPTILAAASPGSGATLDVTLGEGVDWFTGQPYWYVESVDVKNGGTGYVDGDAVDFTVTDGVRSWGASATIITARTQPDVTANVAVAGGVGAVLTPTLSANGNSWTVSGLTITAAGSGYSQWSGIAFATADTTEANGFAYISSVDSNGAITGVVISYGGSYYRPTGVIQSVTVNGGGSYYKSTGVVEAIRLSGGGAYYRLQSTGTAEADVPLVAFGSQIGFGATATATVDSTLGSPTFGQITAIQITNGGQGYKTSGMGWKIMISGVASFHRDELLWNIGYDPTFGTPVDPSEACSALVGYAEPTATRTTTEPCPIDLLSRTYKMADDYIIFPNFFENNCGAVHCIRGQFNNRLTIVDYGGGDIACTLSPA